MANIWLGFHHQGGGSDRNQNVIEPINRNDLRKHVSVCSQRGQHGFWALKIRSDIETEIPNRVEIKTIEPRPTCTCTSIWH